MIKTFKALIAGAVMSAAAVFGTSAYAITAGTIPGGGTNEGLIPVYGTDPVSGYYDANLILVGGPAEIEIEFLGWEALAVNSFHFGGVAMFSNTPFNDWAPCPAFSTCTKTVTGVTSGILDFSFTSNTGAVVTNGSNIDGSGPNSPPNFFVTFQPSSGGLATSGVVVDLWFDDGGAGPDDNHDDLAIRLTVTGGTIEILPVPASVPLLLTALGGLGLVARRRRKS